MDALAVLLSRMPQPGVCNSSCQPAKNFTRILQIWFQIELGTSWVVLNLRPGWGCPGGGLGKAGAIAIKSESIVALRDQSACRTVLRTEPPCTPSKRAEHSTRFQFQSCQAPERDASRLLSRRLMM